MFKKIKPGFDIQYYQLHFKYFKFLRERCMSLSINAYLEFEAVDVSYTYRWPLLTFAFICLLVYDCFGGNDFAISTKVKKKQGFKQTIPYKTCPYSGTLKHITN